MNQNSRVNTRLKFVCILRLDPNVLFSTFREISSCSERLRMRTKLYWHFVSISARFQCSEKVSIIGQYYSHEADNYYERMLAIIMLLFNF